MEKMEVHQRVPPAPLQMTLVQSLHLMIVEVDNSDAVIYSDNIIWLSVYIFLFSFYYTLIEKCLEQGTDPNSNLPFWLFELGLWLRCSLRNVFDGEVKLLWLLYRLTLNFAPVVLFILWNSKIYSCIVVSILPRLHLSCSWYMPLLLLLLRLQNLNWKLS